MNEGIEDVGAEFERNQKVITVIWFAFVVFVVVTVVVAKFALKPIEPEMNKSLKMLFYLLSFAAVILSRAIKSKILSGRNISSDNSSAAKNYMTKVMTAHVISFAMCDLVGMLALFLYFLYGSSVDLYALSGLSIVCLIFNYPKLYLSQSTTVTIH